MTFLIVRSIPLGEETRNAWKNAGGVFLRRDRDGYIPNDLSARHDFVIGLGNSNVRFEGQEIPLFNRPDSIRAVSHPVNLRKTFEGTEVLPERTVRGPHWHKNGGYGGKGKIFHEDARGDCAVMPGDSQRHVAGTEYRVITVGDIVVQAHRKEHDGNPLDGFDWHWVGVGGIRNNGIIPAIKVAHTSIPFGKHTVLGWDVIVGNDVRVLEINTSPGVNTATAQRVVAQIERML